MGAMRSVLLALVPLSLSIGFLACRGPATDEEAAAPKEEQIIGGVDARSASLDAIGALAVRQAADAGTDTDGGEGSTYEPFCTGTLIAPKVVLTAKHCVYQTTAGDPDAGTTTRDEFYHELADVVFAIGYDARAPKKVAKVESVETCNMEIGGFAGLGCDVAIVRLKDAVDDVTPLDVLRTSVDESAVGQRRSAIGYGIQDSAMNNGTRKAGSVTVRATRGPGLQAVFPTFDEFLDAYRVHEGRTLTEQLQNDLNMLWQTPLIDGYELWAGAGEGDVQVCDGDSGGPLLARIDGKNVVVAVASTAVKGIRLPCNLGGSYATFGPKAQEIISRAVTDPCNGITEDGTCEGTVAVRCTKLSEGNRRLTRTDCADLGQQCSTASGTVECTD